MKDGLPGYILDRLFYVRAWNSYVTALGLEHETAERHPHFIGRVMTDRRFRQSACHYEALIRYLLQAMWIGTGRLCGSQAYVRMLNQLAEIPGLREYWSSLVLDDDGSMKLLQEATQDIVIPGRGKFRLFSLKIEYPLFYYLLQYVPMDELAWRTITLARAECGPEVSFAPDASPLHSVG
ncbi:MAG: hypothetical protein GEU75_09560 [Dehalococcoidia bacterium]|nr:hypothetical protein [Dehalococcoidia bacterium]